DRPLEQGCEVWDGRSAGERNRRGEPALAPPTRATPPSGGDSRLDARRVGPARPPDVRAARAHPPGRIPGRARETQGRSPRWRGTPEPLSFGAAELPLVDAPRVRLPAALHRDGAAKHL